MNNTLNNVLIFATGAVIGSVVTWHVAKRKYEAEIESVKEVYRIKSEENNNDTEEPEPEKAEEEPEFISARKYSTYSDAPKTEQLVANVIEEKDIDVPYVIPPEEYGELYGYDEISLTFYADGTLADDMDNPVNINDTVGQAALGCFGQYEDDAVHVRNDKRKADYEVLMDVRKYSEAVCNGAQITED